MKVVFTEHAEKRCVQQDITVENIRYLVSRLPKAKSSFKWQTRSGVAIIYRDTGITRLVITVVGTKKQWKRYLYKQRKIERRIGMVI